MIPIKPQPEPIHFNKKVRLKGQKYLSKMGSSTIDAAAWKSHSYWRDILPDLHEAYSSICAYCAHWISPGTGDSTVEHFIPKSTNRNLAYEWSNYRLVCGTLNGRKSDRSILDPFTLQEGWFILDFPSLMIKPNPTLTLQEKALVRNTLDILQLNEDESFVKLRYKWLMDYCVGSTTYEYFKKHAPFTAYELERQGKLQNIKKIMSLD